MIYNKSGESVTGIKSIHRKPIKVCYTFDDDAIYHNEFTPDSFSVIGDSYSTYDGYTNVGERSNYNIWYPRNNPDFTDVSQTWWKLLEAQSELTLLDIDAYSGSCICYNGYEAGTVDQGRRGVSFIQRVDMVGYAEYIFVFGATNDSAVNVSLGNYVYSNWTEFDKEFFRPACAYLLHELKKIYPLSKIVFIKNAGLRDGIATSIDVICEHYSVPAIELSNIDKSNGHPTRTGMVQIAEQAKAFIDSQVN